MCVFVPGVFVCVDSTGNFCYTFLIETALNESTSSASASAQLVALAAATAAEAAAMPIRFH